MKKRFLVMAVCVSACMPVSALGAEIAGPVISGTAQENNDNKEEMCDRLAKVVADELAL